MKNYLIILTCLGIFSCVNKFDHGYMFEYSNVELLEIGSNKEEVERLMGSPTLISDIDNEVWFYIAEKTKSFIFFQPKISHRQILVVEFLNNKVIDLRKLNLDHQLKNYQFSSKKTEVVDHKTGFFHDLFSNIGNVKPQ